MKYIKNITIIIVLFGFLNNDIILADRNIWQQDEQEEPKEEEEQEEEEEEEKGPWVFTGEFSQVLNQVSFTNWAAGGEDTYSSTSIAGLEVNYKKDNIAFENNLDLRYGLYKSEGQSLMKNDDRIDFTSKVGKEVVEKLSYSAMINYRSQFTEGYNYPNDSVVVSRFMAPGFLTTSIGFDYKPWDFLSIFLAPVTGRFTFVLDDELASIGAFGVDSADNIKTELGAMLTLSFSKRFTDNIRLRSKFEIFNTYKDPELDGWLNNAINWETTIRLKVTEYITVNLLFHMIYDQNIGVPVYETIDGEQVEVGKEYLQFMQSFGLGFSYNF